MSKTKSELVEENALLTARAEDAEGLLSECQAELESLKEKNRRNINDYKKKIKSAVKSTDRLRQEAFENAQGDAKVLVDQAKTLVKRIKDTDFSTKGPVAKAKAEGALEVLRKLFSGV